MRTLAAPLFALALLLQPGAARADEQADRAKLAVDLATLVLSKESFTQLVEKTAKATGDGMSEQFRGEGMKVPADLQLRVREALERLLPYQEMLDLQAGLLVKYFSAGEMREMAAFYKSPAGQKAIKVMPDLMTDVTVTMQAKLQRELPAALKPLVDEIVAANAPKEGAKEEASAPARPGPAPARRR